MNWTGIETMWFCLGLGGMAFMVLVGLAFLIDAIRKSQR